MLQLMHLLLTTTHIILGRTLLICWCLSLSFVSLVPRPFESEVEKEKGPIYDVRTDCTYRIFTNKTEQIIKPGFRIIRNIELEFVPLH